jgi:DNA-binding MarR family transcriptional regulator
MSRQSALIDALTLELRAMRAAADQLDEAACHAMGINRTDGRCLDIIDREGPVTAGRLAAASGLTTAAVTAVIDRLAKAGYARRRDDPSDRRRVLVAITPLARERAEAIWGPFDMLHTEIGHFTVQQLELLLHFNRRAREYNEQRAAEVRALRFDEG